MADNSDQELQDDKPIAKSYATPEQAKIAKEAVQRLDKIKLERAKAIEEQRNTIKDSDQTDEVRRKLEEWAKYQNSKQQPVAVGVGASNDDLQS